MTIVKIFTRGRIVTTLPSIFTEKTRNCVFYIDELRLDLAEIFHGRLIYVESSFETKAKVWLANGNGRFLFFREDADADGRRRRGGGSGLKLIPRVAQ